MQYRGATFARFISVARPGATGHYDVLIHENTKVTNVLINPDGSRPAAVMSRDVNLLFRLYGGFEESADGCNVG